MKATDSIDIASLIQPDRVHHSVYSDPEIFELEMDRLFGRAWLLLGHESQVPKPGDYITTVIGDTPIIVRGNGIPVKAVAQLGGGSTMTMAPKLAARTWIRYNPSAKSALYLVPGLAAYVLALGAVLLTALTVAREWERGSMEQLFATPTTIRSCSPGTTPPTT